MIQQAIDWVMMGGGSNSENPMDKLKKLKELLDMEAITKEEYDEKEKRING